MNDKIEKAVAKGRFGTLKKMAEGRDDSVRADAVRAMGRVPGEESFNYLTSAIRSPAAPIRAAAAEGLGALKDTKARAFLEHQMQLEEDDAARTAIREALASIRDTY